MLSYTQYYNSVCTVHVKGLCKRDNVAKSYTKSTSPSFF